MVTLNFLTTYLGHCFYRVGEDFDVAILNHLITEFKKDSGIDLSNDRLAMQRLREVRGGCCIKGIKAGGKLWCKLLGWVISSMAHTMGLIFGYCLSF